MTKFVDDNVVDQLPGNHHQLQVQRDRAMSSATPHRERIWRTTTWGSYTSKRSKCGNQVATRSLKTDWACRRYQFCTKVFARVGSSSLSRITTRSCLRSK